MTRILSQEEQLRQRVDQLEQELERLRRERDEQEHLRFPWIDNLGRWEYRIDRNEVYFNAAKLTTLGYACDDVDQPVKYQFFTEKLHPEDYEQVMQNMTDHLRGEASAYEVQYRIAAKDGTWKWYYDRGVVTQWQPDGTPQLVCGIVFDITAQKNMEEQLRRQNKMLIEMAEIDELTQVANRKVLLKRLAGELQRWKRHRTKLCIVMLDIDHFKRINDTYGHVTGDSVLHQCAQIIKKTVREVDLVGRYGGEEFLAVLPDTTLEKAVVVAERIRHAVEGESFTEGISVTISGGIAEYSGQSLEEFVDEADTWLYRAKREGRNCIRPRRTRACASSEE